MNKNIKYKMGKISYINASPVFYGLDHGLLPDWLEMVAEPPSVLNNMIHKKEIILSPISAAFYGMHHRDFLVLPDFSISCNGKVMSVMLASRYPIEDLSGKNVVLTDESATASSFVKMLFSLKGIIPEIESKPVKSLDDAGENVDAALVIGDAALTQNWGAKFEHVIDLGEFWYSMTGMPFVFAVWAVRRSFARKNPKIVRNIIDLFTQSKAAGYANIDKIINRGSDKLKLNPAFIKTYYDHLYCDFDQNKIKALEMFFQFLYEEKILKEQVKVELFS